MVVLISLVRHLGSSCTIDVLLPYQHLLLALVSTSSDLLYWL